jgi:hypothetical protein
MSEFVVVYDRLSGRADIQEFTGDSAAALALAARFRAEDSAASTEEVAVLSATSRDALRVTHSRYFGGVRSVLADLRELSA